MVTWKTLLWLTRKKCLQQAHLIGVCNSLQVVSSARALTWNLLKHYRGWTLVISAWSATLADLVIKGDHARLFLQNCFDKMRHPVSGVHTTKHRFFVRAPLCVTSDACIKKCLPYTFQRRYNGMWKVCSRAGVVERITGVRSDERNNNWHNNKATSDPCG